jgi:hypothetical protein
LVQGLENYPESRYFKNMSAMLSTQLMREASKPFNEANSLAGTASSTNIDAYISTMSKASQKYNEAVALFEEVLKYDLKTRMPAITLILARKTLSVLKTTRKV